ncbi:MAG TPA: chemotaxis protein CheD [Gemmatimonadales bacterium]|nr:chemotaxis protein CheD [Gemmatimonadales bacterium]
MSEIIVRVADLRVGRAEHVLVTIGLGSCVAIVLHDAAVRVGGLAHVLLPSPALARGSPNPARVPQTAVPALLSEMAAAGASPRRIKARLVGGASMFAALATPGTIQMGERNVVAARQALASAGVPIVGEAVGGNYGRTVRLHVQDGRVDISSVMHGTVTL